MKPIVAVLLLVAATFATEIRMFDQKSGEITNFYPKNSAEGGMRSRDLGPMIVDGQEAYVGQFPWQVYINIDEDFRCGGSLISTRWVLTAAHCVYLRKSFILFLGVHNVYVSDANAKRFSTRTKIVHENYVRNVTNDVALLLLPRNAPITRHINVIQLPSYSMTDGSIFGKNVTISGWGQTTDDKNSTSPVLLYADVIVLHPLECARAYHGYNSNRMICARNEKKSICRGDSGGALVMWENGKPIQIGVSSFVLGSCVIGKPSYYARVFNYLKWISMETGITIKP